MGGRRAGEAGDRAEDELLVQLGGAAVDGAPDEVGVEVFQPARGLDVAADDE